MVRYIILLAIVVLYLYGFYVYFLARYRPKLGTVVDGATLKHYLILWYDVYHSGSKYKRSYKVIMRLWWR